MVILINLNINQHSQLIDRSSCTPNLCSNVLGTYDVIIFCSVLSELSVCVGGGGGRWGGTVKLI